MAAIDSLKLDSLGTEHRWLRPIIESICLVFERPSYGFQINTDGFYAKPTYYGKVGTPRGHLRLFHSGTHIGDMSFYVSTWCAEIDLVSNFGHAQPKKISLYKRGCGKRSRHLAKKGRLRRPGIRKWAVYAANVLHRDYMSSIASHVMET